MHRERKSNVFILDPQKELEGFDTSGTLLVFVKHAGSTVLYKGILYLGDAAVGWDNGGVVFYGRTRCNLILLPLYSHLPVGYEPQAGS